MVERGDERIWDILEEVIKEHPVLLNRAPTLHRLGIQAFEPVLIDGKALRLHPLVCEAYNADFDGDQMAIHVPLSEEAQAEARILMLAAEHILNPKDGKPVVTPSQDMVLGNYYLTMEEAGREGEGMVFKDRDEAVMAYRNGYVHLHSRVGIATDSLNKPWTEEQKHKVLLTTVGKILFNDIMPEGLPYLQEPTNANLTEGVPAKYFLPLGGDIKEAIRNLELNPPFKKKNLGNIIAEIFKRFRTTETSALLDRMKNLGYHHSTLAGLTVGIADIPVVEDKAEIIEESHQRVAQITKQFRRGMITDDERYNAVTAEWRAAREKLEKRLVANQDPKNPIVMMMDSGARGNISNFSQLAGMRGLMAAPNGRIMELPILSNFREGLSVLEMFFSTHGARKGMTDTALKTADSGYLTRRLVDVAQDVIIREDDCGTDRGLLIRSIAEGKEMIESLEERLNGRYTKKTVKHPETGAVIIGPNELITEDKAREIVNAGVEESLSVPYLHVTLVMVSAVTVTVSTWRLAMRLKLVKQLVQSLPNLSGNLVHSLQCVPSTRVGLPQIPISLRVFLVSKKSLKPAIRKGKRLSLKSRVRLQPSKKMHQLVPRKSLLRVKLAKVNTWCHLQHVCVLKLETKSLVVQH